MARFEKGQSGNRGGRTPSPETLARRLIAPHLPVLVERTVANALNGDGPSAVALIGLYRQIKTAPRRPAG